MTAQVLFPLLLSTELLCISILQYILTFQSDFMVHKTLQPVISAFKTDGLGTLSNIRHAA